MKTTALLLLLAALNLFAAEPAPDDKPKASAYFADMRTQYASRPEFHGGWVSEPEREALLKTYSENAPNQFVTGSEAWLQKCPVDAKVHLMRASLLLKAGDVQGHFYHRMVYYGLLTAIVTSGDGKTPKTAYKVISVDEEYTLLNHIGADLKSQTLVDGPCDAMAVELNGSQTTIYFNVAIPMAARKKSVEQRKAK